MTMHKKLVELVDNRVTTTLKENSIDATKRKRGCSHYWTRK